MIDPGEKLTVTLKREFSEEAMNSLEASNEEKKQIEEHVSELFNRGEEVSIATNILNYCVSKKFKTWVKFQCVKITQYTINYDILHNIIKCYLIDINLLYGYV